MAERCVRLPVHQLLAVAALTEPWPGWHCVTIEDTPGGWMVVCIPHGLVSDLVPTHLAAFEAAFGHDWDNGTVGDKG